MHGTQWLVADAGLQSIPHQLHGITGWFNFCESSDWSIVQGSHMVERYRSSRRCWFLFNIYLLDTAIYEQSWPLKQHLGSHFAGTARVMSLLPTCSCTHLLLCEWLEGLCSLGMRSGARCIHVTIRVATVLCHAQKHPESHFAWTTRVITLLPTCSHTHLWFAKGLEGLGMPACGCTACSSWQILAKAVEIVLSDAVPQTWKNLGKHHFWSNKDQINT